MRRFYCLLVLLLLLPDLAAAQRKPKVFVTHRSKSCCYDNHFSVEPYGGIIKDPYDISPDGDNTALLLGVRLNYHLGYRIRLLANAGYNDSDNVSDPQGLTNYYLYDNTWIYTTAGAEFDVVPGRGTASFSLEAGAGWRRVDLDGQVGVPLGQSQEDSGFNARFLVIPSLTGRFRVGSHFGVALAFHDYIFDVFDGPTQHGVAGTFAINVR